MAIGDENEAWQEEVDFLTGPREGALHGTQGKQLWKPLGYRPLVAWYLALSDLGQGNFGLPAPVR